MGIGRYRLTVSKSSKERGNRMTETAETPMIREYRIGNTIYRVKSTSNGQTKEEPKDTIKRLIQRNTRRNGHTER